MTVSQGLPHTLAASDTHQSSQSDAQHEGTPRQTSAAQGSHEAASAPPVVQTSWVQLAPEQSAGQVPTHSPGAHTPSPHRQPPQSAVHEVQVSDGNSHSPLPQVQAPQSVAQTTQVSPGSQVPSPHVVGHRPQSPGHVAQSSRMPLSHQPSPQTGQLPQSPGQLAQSSCPSVQKKSPQVAGQILPHVVAIAMMHEPSHSPEQHHGLSVQIAAAQTSHAGASAGPVSQRSCAHAGHPVGQSRAHEPPHSVRSHRPSPQTHAQSRAQLAQLSAPVHASSPQTAGQPPGQSKLQSAHSPSSHQPSPHVAPRQKSGQSVSQKSHSESAQNPSPHTSPHARKSQSRSHPPQSASPSQIPSHPAASGPRGPSITRASSVRASGSPDASRARPPGEQAEASPSPTMASTSRIADLIDA